MSSVVADNCETIISHDDFIDTKSSSIDQTIFKSLFDESHNEYCDDERLSIVIQSLEAEIAPIGTNYYVNNDHLRWESDPIECQSTSANESTVELNLLKLHDLDFEWIDFEMAPSSPSGGMASWYMMETYGQEMGEVTDFGGLKNYSQLSYGTPLIMDDPDYGLSWHETNDSELKN